VTSAIFLSTKILGYYRQYDAKPLPKN